MFQYLKSIEGFSTLFRKNFLTGVFVLIPFGVVAWILTKVFGALWTFHRILPTAWQPEHYFEPLTAQFLNFALTIALTFVFILWVSVLGWASKQYLGAKILGMLSLIIQRIPVVRAVYSSLNQLLKTMSLGGKQQFNRVVYLEYPRKGVWALAFVTSSANPPDAQGPYLNVYVPTTPNPTSGFHLIVPESDVKDSHLTVEAAFTTILSLGIAQGKKSNE